MTQSVPFGGADCFPEAVFMESWQRKCVTSASFLFLSCQGPWLSPLHTTPETSVREIDELADVYTDVAFAGMQRWWPSMSAEFLSSRGQNLVPERGWAILREVRRQGLCRRPPLESFIWGVFSAQNIFLLNVPEYAPWGSWEIHTLLHNGCQHSLSKWLAGVRHYAKAGHA